MTEEINLDSSSLQSSTWIEVLRQQDKVYSHSTMSLRKINRSLIQACMVLFSSFCAISVGLKCGFHPHQVFAMSSSTLSNAINSHHWVNTLYNGTIYCFSTLNQSSIASIWMMEYLDFNWFPQNSKTELIFQSIDVLVLNFQLILIVDTSTLQILREHK